MLFYLLTSRVHTCSSPSAMPNLSPYWTPFYFFVYLKSCMYKQHDFEKNNYLRGTGAYKKE